MISRKNSISLCSALGLLLLFTFGCRNLQSRSTPSTQPAPFRTQVKEPVPESTPTKTTEITGRVVGVSDGDTITVLDAAKTQYKIRLQGIDAPETGQDFGQVSKQHLSNLVYGKTVRVVLHKKDRYGRDIGTVYSEGIDVNLEQVKAGLAWHYKQYQNEQTATERKSYSESEKEARVSKRGLWQQTVTIPPWDYRNGGTGNSGSNDYSGATNVAQGGNRGTSSVAQGEIRGNSRSKIYHWPGCRNYNDISPTNRVLFNSAAEAEAAGYRAAKNCGGLPPQSSVPLAATNPRPAPSIAPARPSHPAGATAICRDGTYSYSASRRGTCSHHGGVAQWL